MSLIQSAKYKATPLCRARLLAALWVLATYAVVAVAPAPARADQFEVIPAGNPIYTQMNTVGKAGWLTAPTNSNRTLTRYEVALETAKAIFTVTAQQRADVSWGNTASRPALRALIDLTNSLRPELQQLQIDPAATTTMLNGMLHVPVTRLQPHTATVAPVRTPTTTARPGAGFSGLRFNRNTELSSFAGSRFLMGPRSSVQSLKIPLSQRLRLETTVLALKSEENDPFGDTQLARRPLTVGTARGNSIVPVQLGAGATYDVNNWVRFTANYDREAGGPTLWQGNPTLGLGTTEHSVGAGVGLSVLTNLTLTSAVSRVTDDRGTDTSRATRYQSGVDVSALRDRLVLSAKVSRLVPEDAVALPSTAADFNLGFDVTKRLSLKLLYKGIFGQPDQNHVAGGISIKW